MWAGGRWPGALVLGIANRDKICERCRVCSTLFKNTIMFGRIHVPSHSFLKYSNSTNCFYSFNVDGLNDISMVVVLFKKRGANLNNQSLTKVFVEQPLLIIRKR